jgi:hypothetical protein
MPFKSVGQNERNHGKDNNVINTITIYTSDWTNNK